MFKKKYFKNLSLLNKLDRGYELDERYVANNKGEVHLVKSEDGDNLILKRIKPYKNRDGYIEYVLTNKNSKKKHIMEQIVTAGLWLPKPKNCEYVNHKHGDRTNNFYKDVEWMTQSENIKHSYDVLGRKPANKKD